MITDAAFDKSVNGLGKPILPLRFMVAGPLIALGTMGIMAASVWFIKRETQRNFNLRAAQTTQWAQTNSQEFIDKHLTALRGVTQIYINNEKVAKESFKDKAGATIRDHPSLTAINYVDQDFVVAEVYPFTANRIAVNLDLKSRFDVLPVAHRAITHRDVAITDLIDLVQGGKGLLIYAPIFRENRWKGLIEGVLKIDDLIDGIIGKDLREEYHYTIIDETNGKEVHTSLLPTAYERSTPFDTYFTARMGDRTWWVILHPKSPPMVLLPLVFVLILELGGGVYAGYWLWKKNAADLPL